MEPTTTPQQKPPEKHKTTANSLLNLLTRRSTKVEPSLESNTNSILNSPVSVATTSAHSSPVSTINQFRQGHLRRHSSTQNISSIRREESVSPLHTVKRNVVGGHPKKAKSSSSTNRFSHQFTLCCSVHDDRMCTPPVSVRYNSLAQVELRRTTLIKPSSDSDADITATTENGGHHVSNVSSKTETIAQIPNGHTIPSLASSNSFTTVTVHSHHQESIPAPSGPAVTTDDSSNDDSTDRPVVFNEFQSPSIAMSACRSRLRERLLPPAGHLVRSLDLPNSPPITAAEQHFSSPNISTIPPSTGSSPARDKPTTISKLVTNQNRSLSYDVLTGVRRPASADSLAKQSLIAAQLLNLIPAERARER